MNFSTFQTVYKRRKQLQELPYHILVGFLQAFTDLADIIGKEIIYFSLVFWYFFSASFIAKKSLGFPVKHK